jgi:hypothetical protein
MRVILIEDRTVRKELFLSRSEIDFTKYNFFKEVTPEEYTQLKSDLKTGDLSFFRGCDVILTHKSAFTLNEQDALSALGKSVVYFSGGISQSFYLEFPSPTLHINSSDFYSSNLLYFLEKIATTGEIEMLILQFGDKWKLNLLLNLRDKLKQMIYRNEGKDLYPEDFDLVFNNKVLSIIESEQLKSDMVQLQKQGLSSGEIVLLSDVFSEINNQVMNQIL